MKTSSEFPNMDIIPIASLSEAAIKIVKCIISSTNTEHLTICEKLIDRTEVLYKDHRHISKIVTILRNSLTAQNQQFMLIDLIEKLNL